jgi:hypothetical protein
MPEEEKIDFMAALKAVWKRKWMVMAVIALSIIGALAYLWKATPLYQVTMQLKPGITDYDRDTPKRGWKNNDLQNWIEKWLAPSFLSQVRKRGEKPLRIRAQAARNAQTVSVSLLTPNPERGKALLEDFFSFMTDPENEQYLDTEIVLARSEMDNEIKNLANQLNLVDTLEKRELLASLEEKQREIRVQEDIIALLEQQYLAAQNSLEQVQKQAGMIQKSIEQPLGSTPDSGEKTPHDNRLALSNDSILQPKMYYLSLLQERIALLQKNCLDIRVEKIKAQALIESYKEKIGLLRLSLDKKLSQKKEEIVRQIESKKQQMAALRPVERITGPVATRKPVSPQRNLAIVVAALLGLFLGSAAAVVRDRYGLRPPSENR